MSSREACTFRKCETFTNKKLYFDSYYTDDEEKPLSNCHDFYLRFYVNLEEIFFSKKVPDLHNIRLRCVSGVQNATCTRYNVTKRIYDWLHVKNTPVREALHIDTDLNWIPGNELNFRLFGRQYPTLHGHIMFLLSKNIRVLLYTGELDGVVSPYSTHWFLNDLHLTPSNYGKEEWKFKSKTAGTRIRFCEGLSRYDIYGAGHTPSEDKPAETAQMVEEFLFGDNSAIAMSPICSGVNATDSSRNFLIPIEMPPKMDGYTEYWIYSFVRYFARYFSKPGHLAN